MLSPDAERRRIEALENGEIVSWEIPPNFGAEYAFAVGVALNYNRILLRCEHFASEDRTAVVLLPDGPGLTIEKLAPILTIPDAIETLAYIRQSMADGWTYEDAIEPFRLKGRNS